MNEETVHNALVALLGDNGVSRSPEVLRRYASDALRPNRASPAGVELTPSPQWVARPASVVQVQGLIRLANELLVPLVPFGGGSGLMGGALAANGGIVVDMGRLNRVRAVRPGDRTVTAEAGTVLADVNKALQQHKLFLGHDPWTVPVATVGGTISTNSLGYLGGKYGSMGQQVLGIEAVLPDGTLLETRAVPKTSAGLRLEHLFIGGEGCFGIITAATLQAAPLPEVRHLEYVCFPSFEAGFKAVERIFAEGYTPSVIDYGESYPTATPEGWGPPPSTFEAELYIGFEGPRKVVTIETHRALAICKRFKGQRGARKEVKDFWASRHAPAERFARNREETGLAPYLQPNPGPQADYVHVALPASQVLPYRVEAMALAQSLGVQVRECGLWNRPELFSMVMIDPEGLPGRLGGAVDRVLELAQDVGGSMEYVHGVGLRLAHLMEREHGTGGIHLLRQLKRTLDPNNIMNPGKLGL